MALVACPECGHQVSDNAVSCPQCGFPLAQAAERQRPTEIVATYGLPVAGRDGVRTRPLSFGLGGTVAGFWWATAAAYALVAITFLLTFVAWDDGAPAVELIEMESAALAFFGLAAILLVLTGILFLIWFFQAYKSAESLGASGRTWSTGWTLVSWIVPLANLVLPKLVMNEIDRMSNPLAGRPPIEERWKGLRRLTPSNLWWIALIGGGVGLNLAQVFYTSATTYDDGGTGTGYMLFALSTATLSVAAALAGVVVVTIGRRLRS